MKKYIVKWDSGYGMTEEIQSFIDETDAEEYARMMAYEEAESNLDWRAIELTKETAEEHGYEEEFKEINNE